jgi:hypothetical protein
LYNNDLSNGRTYKAVYTATGATGKTFRQLIDEFSATARELYNSGKELRIRIDEFPVTPFFHDANRVGFSSVAEVGGGLLYSRVICGTNTTTVYTVMTIGVHEVDHSAEDSNGHTFILEMLV